ncbi:MAG: LamG-like jellyroll fold domain-containing protein [Planctomycetota bacterium]
MNDPRETIAAYFEGRLSADQVAELEAWLREDHERTRLLVREAMIGTHLVELLSKQNLEHMISDPEDAFSDDPGTDQHVLLETMIQAEERGEDLDPMAMAAARFPKPIKETPSRRDYFAAGRYLYEHYVTPRVIGTTAAAAALLLGAVLAIVFLTSGNGTPDIVETPGLKPTAPSPDPDRVVATVTDQVNAQWVSANGQGALPDRMLLATNQRLTLVQGFAEITTKRGAKVLLQAPATVETTDSDNAIRLHRGKLVGRCETPQSKGFTVHAPGLDVVDLGTVFGVEADTQAGSTVLVMDGSVRAQPTEQSPRAFEPVVLRKDEARRVQPQTGSLETIAATEAPGFYREAPHPYVVAVLDARPVAYWRFEEQSGRAVVNEADARRDALQMVGPATLTDDGLLGRAGLLTNRAEPFGYFETANPIDQLAGFEEGTIEFWYYADHHHKVEDERENAMLISLFDAGQVLDEPGSTSKQMIAVELTDDSWLFDTGRATPAGWLPNAMRVYPEFFIDGQDRRDLYSDHKHPVQRWQHVALVKDQDSIMLYLDGEPAQAMPHAFGPITPVSVRLGRTYPFKVRADASDPDFHAPPRPWMGRLDEVALYDKPLTAEQVARHHALATGGDAP